MSDTNKEKGIVLVVDNNPENLRLLENILTVNGYKVRPAISGALALMTIQSTLPDLILLDVRMPEIDGYTVCKKIKENDITKDIPVIFISALGEPIDKIKAFEAGGMDYITKPFESQEVLARVKTQIKIRKMQQKLATQNKQLQSEIADRKEIERQLQITQQNLEIRVKKRTQDLEKANENLQAEIQQRKDAQKDKEQLQHQLQQAQKLEAIGTLAGGIAHDFNNILTIIHTCSQLVMSELDSNQNAYLNIEKILKASERASELVNQILTFSRHHQTAHFSPISIIPILKEAIKLLKTTLPPGITLRNDIKINSEMILGDGIQIYQVIMNLCTNAFHAMEKDETGEMIISLDTQMITEDDLIRFMPLRPGNHIQLSVKDTGEGIAPPLIERIFDPYFTTKGKGRGTGLGLAVTRGIVEKHNGTILVNSQINQGTQFDVYFPIIHRGHETHEESQAPILKGSEHILLVDDEIDLLHTVQLLLEHIGYQVTAYNNATDALAEFGKRPEQFDLVIADLAMPKMNGKQLS
ncbi:MAG: histidine kinase, partial [Candidatus Magnetoglobus multicellularis str. Araruama]